MKLLCGLQFLKVEFHGLNLEKTDAQAFCPVVTQESRHQDPGWRLLSEPGRAGAVFSVLGLIGGREQQVKKKGPLHMLKNRVFLSLIRPSDKKDSLLCDI